MGAERACNCCNFAESQKTSTRANKKKLIVPCKSSVAGYHTARLRRVNFFTTRASHHAVVFHRVVFSSYVLAKRTQWT